MGPEKKPSVSIKFPAVPGPEASDIVIAMGRLAMAWSSSEFYLVLLLTRLMASADLSTINKVRDALSGKIVGVVDTNAVHALFFAVESSRGRRKLVMNLADARLGEGYLTKQSYAEIKALLEKHGTIGRVRNTYAHTAMGLRSDGSYVLLNGNMMVSREDGTRRQRSAKVRANNNKVQANMIDDVTERLNEWIEEARNLLTEIATSASPSQPLKPET